MTLLHRSEPITTYRLFVPELGSRRPIYAILPCPERIKIAWHRDARGVLELLDEHGHGKYGGPPQERLWQVREYQRTTYYEDARKAFYEEVPS